ncbi:MAG TPA: MarR family transcriptional regulator [Stellaceae bacterium]|nr:MarR family transcriptional regulator [Stellaceae bacterium]
METNNEPSVLLPLIVADIFELAGRFRDNGEAIARTVGQTQARWQVMSAAAANPRTVPQIARRLGVTRQNVQRIADLLVAENWARFEANPDHRNSPYLVLSERGHATLARLTEAADARHRRVAQTLAGDDLQAIHRGLRRLLDATADTALIEGAVA